MEVPLQDDHQVKLAELGWTTEDFRRHEDVFFDSLIWKFKILICIYDHILVYLSVSF